MLQARTSPSLSSPETSPSLCGPLSDLFLIRGGSLDQSRIDISSALEIHSVFSSVSFLAEEASQHTLSAALLKSGNDQTSAMTVAELILLTHG